MLLKGELTSPFTGLQDPAVVAAVVASVNERLLLILAYQQVPSPHGGHLILNLLGLAHSQYHNKRRQKKPWIALLSLFLCSDVRQKDETAKFGVTEMTDIGVWPERAR